VDDIFSDVQDTPAVPPAPKSFESRLTSPDTFTESPRQGFKKIVLTIAGIAVIVGMVGAGGWFAYDKFLKPQPLNPNLNINVSPQPEPQPQPQPEPTPQPVVLDNDNDGLTDAQEADFKTDPFNPDTDGDGLFDGEEVNIYHTDPLNPDTDGDTYKDGSEVKNGYDPLGPGKLINIPGQ
jgi:hypothetical protein